MHALPRESPVPIHEQVVHDATQPRPGFLDFHEFVELAECLDQEFLEQVLGLSLGASEAPRETIQPVEVRPNDAIEDLGLLWISHCKAECIATESPPDKELCCYS